MRQQVLGEVGLTLLRRGSAECLPSPLPSPDGTLSQSEPVPALLLRGLAAEPRVLTGLPPAAQDTWELQGLRHTSNCCLNGLEVTELQVMADMFLPGRARALM